jgi:hypothetical protein
MCESVLDELSLLLADSILLYVLVFIEPLDQARRVSTVGGFHCSVHL